MLAPWSLNQNITRHHFCFVAERSDSNIIHFLNVHSFIYIILFISNIFLLLYLLLLTTIIIITIAIIILFHLLCLVNFCLGVE